MTTHDPQVPQAIRQVRVRASPDQTHRLLCDIARVGHAVMQDRGQTHEH